MEFITILTVTVNGVVLEGTSRSTITRIYWDWGDENSDDMRNIKALKDRGVYVSY